MSFTASLEKEIFFGTIKTCFERPDLKDWQGCTWLIDDQSELLREKMYTHFFRLENCIRAFANKF